MADEKQSVVIYYEERPAKPTIVAHGGFGGPTAGGTSVAIHLYAESPPIPSIEEVAIDASTGQGTGSNIIKRGDARREVQATLILTPEGAVQIGAWLANHGQACIDKRSAAEG